MNPTINLPSYEELFGDLDFNKGDQARAVYSPAAYLADLLQLLDDKFEKHSLAQRRIGLKKIPLDAENTFTEVPYLDIVNEVLENTLGANVYENLRDTKKPTARYPFNLPFHLENEKVKRYLYYLGVPSEQLYKQFALQVDFNLVAREYLGLSDEEWTVITTAQPNEPAIRDFYHLDQLTPFDDLRKEVLTPVGSFLKITNLTGTALRELLFQNLSTRATDRESRSERTRASTFFIHHQLNGYVTLGDNEETLVWSDGTAPIPLEWFDRANRFVRLANKIKFSFADLDLILRTCCQHKLDPEAIQTIAIVKQLHDLYDLPVDVVCSFFAPLNTLGIGDEETPQDLFNQIFNVKFAPTDKKYIPGSAFIPEAYQGYEILSCTGDLLSLNNKEYRHRLGKALGLSDKALTSIVTQYRKKYASDKSATSLSGEGELGLRALSLLHRISKLVDVLDSSPAELFALLDILEKDPSIRKFNNFDLLIEHAVQQQDCYRILEEGGAAALWLVQLLFAATQWMHANDFTAEELNQILTGRYQSTTEQANNRAHKLKVLDDLYQQFRTVMLTPELFVSDRFTARASRVIHQILTENGAGLVSKQDKRLVRFDATMAADVAYQALTQLAVIHKEDFTQLGLEQRLLDKLFDNLIIHGYLQADGVLVEPRLPKSAADFTLSSDFSAQREALFTLIHEFYSDEDQEQAVSADGDALVEIALFPADLIALEELSEAQRNELYDNLIFNGYIDADGNLLRTDFFARAANVADFVVNADLGAVSAALFDHIMSQIKQFEQQPLQLDATVFADLALTQAEPDDLIENLKFNQYIDQANVFLDKSNLLAQNLDEFNLALPFYPQRRAILNALKVPIQEFKSKFYTFPKETFRELADTAVAQQVVDRLAVDFLRNNQVKEAQKSFFLDAENIGLFELGAPFSESDHAVIFDQIATILADQQTYQLPIAALDELEFDVYETAELIEVLTADGHLTDQLMLPADKISYVLNVNHALEFSIEAFEDYNKDIFFILHDVAKEMDAAIAEIVAKIEAQANSQESVLFDVLQDAFGVPVDLVKTICRYVLGGLDHVVEAFVLPILAVVDANDVVAKEPDTNKFNFAYKRIFQFALLAAKLGLNQAETEIIFRDQDLVEKFPEKLALPEEPQSIDRFDALLESPDGTIYLFKDARYWAYSAQNYTLLPAETHEIVSLAQRFAELTQIDAAFTDSNGTSFLVGRDQKRQSRYFYKEKDSRRWIEKAKTWGKVNSNFADPERIDTAFQDKEGKIYLFSGTQYIRYSNGSDTAAVDEGYPLTIADNWEKEGLNAYLPARFKEAIDASFQGLDEKTYLFQGNHYVSSDALSSELEIKAKWGRVRNNFQPAVRIDAAYTDGATYLLFAGDQVIAYHDSLENDGVCVLEGYPRRIEAYFGNLPAEFESGLEAAFRGLDGQIYLLKDGKTLTPAVTPLRTFSVKERWGVVTNKVQQTGKVDAAFVGLDGKTYLFSDDQYIRYSGTNYAQVDEGYPRLIAGDWGGLQKVDAVFVMDGKTYLFGIAADGKDVYVRYSTKDYSVQDEGYPREPHENWWNLPAKLVKEKATFAKIDAVFNGKDNRTYLFSGDQFVFFDNKHRWWSEPQALSTQWDSIPFGAVDAAFVGTDGKTYLFSGQQYIRYSTSNYSKIDDRYPNDIKTFWGNGVNNIAKTEKVDAVLVLESYELVGGVEKPQIYTYLFSGNQYFRYAGAQTTTVENGYPKYIATSLKQEPRFKNLTFSFENGIDAGLADQRSIYLFKDATCYVVSDALYKSYDLKQQKHLNFSKAGCAFLEDGALILEELGAVEAENRWYRYTALEGYTVEKTAVYPALLRTVPDKFRRGLNAVLKGVDKNTYLFKGGDCFNVLLNKEYPLAEEWGRARNNIYLNNTVDAAFVGRDKKTYLFSGDQFVVYSGNVYVGAEIDGHPKPIKDHWGGLNSVALAYVKDDKTYLFEKADSEGTFRYVCYSTADYTQPDADFPQTADLDFWQIPISYRNEGFTEVTAVLFEGDNMFLLGRERYLQFNDETGLWSYPRPLSRIWRDPQDRLSLPLEKRLTAGLKTAFTGADGATHFFSAEQYIRYFDHKFDEPDLIKNRWGLARNNFINHRRAKIDAAFVYQDKTTYLFSGDQYIRYSSTDYRFVDEGYPKPILNHLRQEEAFKHLPDAFEESLVDHIAQGRDPVFDAVITNGRNLYLLIENHCHVVSQSLTATYDLNRIGRVKNHLVDNNKVDAALVHGNYTYLFSGDQYVRYSNDDYETVDDGYPKTLASSFAGEVGLTHLDDAFHYGIDAALGTANGDMYLFKGKDYLKLDSADPKPQAINKYWGKVYNQFVADANDTTIDAAFISPNGCLYAFKDGQYIRYQASEQEFVDEGYPKLIRNNWGNLPPVFEQGIDGGFVFEGKTYLLKGNEYVRYSNADYQSIDPIYPQAFRYRWGAWADYLLTDIKTITRFKQLQDAYTTADGSLADFLNPTQGSLEAPYELLSALFGWDIDELKWLKRRNGFLSTANYLFEEQFQLELIIKLSEVFATADKMGAAPSDVFTNIWEKLYALRQVEQAAAALYRYLALKHGEKEWQVLCNQIHAELNVIKRDALVPAVIAQEPGIENARDLYERLLIDVEMGSQGVTSRVQEAIAATQLFFHRYFVNLEAVEVSGGKEEEVRQELKRWWKWMKNYRVWEANRKVFLYPENYIRPELRDTKTPAFKTLEEDLLQGEITAATVQRAYKKYLDEYTEVSRLTIAGGYVYDAPESTAPSRNLVLFGRTKTDPRRYYYRLAEFFSGQQDSALWSPWLKVNVQIDADKVYPVFAFHRVFVFWTKVEALTNPPASTAITSRTDGNTQTVASAVPPSFVVKIYYSFYNLNKEWVPAQTLTAEIPPASAIENLKLFVENSDKLITQGKVATHENIIINCSYTVHGAETNHAFRLTPELYTERADKPKFDNNGLTVFDHIFDEHVFDDTTVVMFSTLEKSSDGPWFSFDHKGGSFLCKPAVTPLAEDAWPQPLANNPDQLPAWNRIDAAFEWPAGQAYFFRNDSQEYIVSTALNDKQATRQRWGKVRNNIAETGIVDAATEIGGKIYLFSGNQYLTYSHGLKLADAGCPKSLADNHDQLPLWERVDAAFTASDGKTYFFRHDSQEYVVSTALNDKHATRQRWGKARSSEFTTVAAAFTAGNHTYLIDGNHYLRYQGDNYDTVEPGFPRAFTSVSDIPELTIARRASAIDPKRLTGAFYYQNILYFQYGQEEQFRQLEIKSGQAPNHQDFRAHLNEEPLTAVVVHDPRVYVFKRKAEGGVSFDTLCIYDINKAEWTHHSIKLVDGKRKKIAIDHALLGKNGKFYLFSGDQYMESADWLGLIQRNEDETVASIRWQPAAGSIADDWLRFSDLPNRIAETGIVDAAFVKGNYTYLLSGDQYVRYTGTAYDFIDSGYPKLIEENDANLPRWRQVGAALSTADATYFFDNSDQTYIEAAQPARKHSTRQAWGLIKNSFTQFGLVDSAYVSGNYLYLTSNNQFVRYTLSADNAPAEYVDSGYPKSFDWPSLERVQAAFVVGKHSYLIGDNHFVKFTQEGDQVFSTPQAVAGKLGALLTSLNFPEIPAAYATLPIHAAYVDRDVLTIRSGSRILACRLNEKSIAPDELSSHFEFAYVNGDGVVQQSALAIYDAAFAAGGKFYVFKGNEYVELATVPATIAEIQWQAPRKIADKWSIGKIDAAFTQGEKVYVFSGDRYAKLQNGQEPNALTDFQHIQGNWGNLPYELRSGMDAAFERADALYLFKGDQYIKYAKGDAADETAIPYEIWDAKYKIVRLTTSTAYKLNQKLFAGGVTALLNIATQEIDELPSFSEDESTPTTIKVRGGKVDAQALPVSSHLDFNSANGIYYWEVFFHAPFLIAQSLSSGQKFAEAKEWYEYIFDPTELVDYWKFLPFLAVDVQALINSYHSYLTQLQELKSAIAPVEGDFTQLFTMLEEKAVGGKSIVQVFRQLRRLPPDEETALYQQINALSTVLTSLRQHVQALLVLPEVEKNPRAKRIVMSLAERTEIIGKLGYRYELIGDHAAQIQTFLDDPFDPHAIAALRPLAYRKAIVMGYVDNLLNWGDLLFRQYTRESIDEARMLYILAYDLLGEKPENLGVKILSATQDYSHLRNDSPGYEIELYIDDGKEVATHPVAVLQATPHKSVATPYFFIPENRLFGDYWTRVEDRLYKIRASLNILGISQPLPLFEPPIDPLALVQAVSAGASVSSALASMNIPVPHYRFLFMLRKAQELVQKLNGFGNDLLAVLEKKDAEALNLLQNRQEAVILGMTRSIKEAQLNAAAETIDELEQSLQAANSRISHYERLQSAGLLPTEIAQIALMAAAAAAHSVSSGLRIAASFGSAAPDSLVGPFIAGVKYGGSNAGNSLSSAAEVAESLGEGLSVTGEILGVLANYERTAEDWDLQLALAQSDVIQIGHQLEGARLQHKIAQRELEILEQEIAHNEAIKTFMKDKFANAQLYQWMAGKLSGMYFQTYNLAYEMAKAAEKAFQFEQGLKESEVNYIQPLFWDSQKNGLLAGESLGLDLDRMEKAYYDSNRRSFEITKNISLLELDPVAFLQLKSKGVCEFALTEALFDYDFPGHYCRQIKTLSLTFHAAEGQRVDVNATLTQLNHKTVLEPDAKAVKYLLDPKDQPPLSLRSGWKANQQIALSYIADDYEKNNGLFELRFDDDRYLPFEGTGAVSTWRLELNGKKGSYNVNDLVDVTMTLQYTAEQGGALFANTVKGMLKPYPTARFFDVAQEFPDEWEEFMAGDDTELVLTFTRAMFPNLSSSKITGILARYELLAPGPLTMMLQEADDLILRDGKYLLTTGLSINSQGSEWTFTVNGDKSQLKNVNLVLGYKAM